MMSISGMISIRALRVDRGLGMAMGTLLTLLFEQEQFEAIARLF
jgi:hypothetical protein